MGATARATTPYANLPPLREAPDQRDLLDPKRVEFLQRT